MNSDEQLLAKSSNAQPTKKFANTGMKFSSHILNNALHLQQSSEVALKQRGDNFLVGAPGTRSSVCFWLSMVKGTCRELGGYDIDCKWM